MLNKNKCGKNLYERTKAYKMSPDIQYGSQISSHLSDSWLPVDTSCSLKLELA